MERLVQWFQKERHEHDPMGSASGALIPAIAQEILVEKGWGGDPSVTQVTVYTNDDRQWHYRGDDATPHQLDVNGSLEAKLRAAEERERSAYDRGRLAAIEEFVDKVLNYDQGCRDGKVEFLRDCGYPVPQSEYTITVRITVDEDTDAQYDAQVALCSALEGESGVHDYHVDEPEVW